MSREHVAAVPPLPAVVQVKVLGPLLRYPGGQTGMVWYGAADDGRALLGKALTVLPSRWGDNDLVFRYRPSETPQADLARLLNRFERRFGALPGQPTAPQT